MRVAGWQLNAAQRLWSLAQTTIARLSPALAAASSLSSTPPHRSTPTRPLRHTPRTGATAGGVGGLNVTQRALSASTSVLSQRCAEFAIGALIGAF